MSSRSVLFFWKYLCVLCENSLAPVALDGLCAQVCAVPFAVSAVSVNVCSGDEATLSFAGGIPCWIRSKDVARFEEWHTQKERKVARQAVKSEANATKAKDILKEITKRIPTDVFRNGTLA